MSISSLSGVSDRIVHHRNLQLGQTEQFRQPGNIHRGAGTVATPSDTQARLRFSQAIPASTNAIDLIPSFGKPGHIRNKHNRAGCIHNEVLGKRLRPGHQRAVVALLDENERVRYRPIFPHTVFAEHKRPDFLPVPSRGIATAGCSTVMQKGWPQDG